MGLQAPGFYAAVGFADSKRHRYCRPGCSREQSNLLVHGHEVEVIPGLNNLSIVRSAQLSCL